MRRSTMASPPQALLGAGLGVASPGPMSDAGPAGEHTGRAVRLGPGIWPHSISTDDKTFGMRHRQRQKHDVAGPGRLH